MGYSLTSTPAYLINGDVSPAEYSFLLATDCPSIFQFQRNDGTITLAEDSGSPSYLQITLAAGYVCVDGDTISIYDALYDQMIEATVTSDLGGGVFITDVDWDARYATDLTYILNYTQRQNYYIEGRLTINSLVEQQTIKASPNTKGLVKMDVQDFLRAAVSGDKVGTYTNLNDAETNQSGNFTLEYRERYTGDASTYTSEGNTWYFVYAIRTKEQGSNLWEYLGTDNQEAKWFNAFDKPIYNEGLPFDMQFFWPYDYANLSVTKKYYDASNTLLSTVTTALDASGRGLLNSITISESDLLANTDHIVISIDEP